MSQELNRKRWSERPPRPSLLNTIQNLHALTKRHQIKVYEKDGIGTQKKEQKRERRTQKTTNNAMDTHIIPFVLNIVEDKRKNMCYQFK